MKKFTLFSLFLVCSLAFSFMQAQSVTVPDPGTVYTIKQIASGRYLTRSLGSSAPVIKVATSDLDQQFQFVPVAGVADTYQIMCVGYDEYLARLDAGNTWTMSWVADPNNAGSWPSSTIADPTQNAQWQIVNEGTYVTIKNVAGGAYMGTDATSDNSSTYANKGETEERSKWIIAVATGAVDKEPLQILYDEAKALYDNTSEGTGSNQYPADTRAALASALTAALAVLQDDGAYQEDVNDALAVLTTALAAYRASVYPFQPSTSATYYIEHSSGFYFTGSSIATATYAEDQQFKFVAVGNNYYNIQPASDASKYLTRQDNGWDLGWGTDGTVSTAQFIMRSTGTGYYTIQCAALTGGKTEPAWFMGTDNNTSGSSVYIDKNGTDGKHYWKIIDISTVAVVKTALEDAVAKVADFLQYAVRGDGADQYPATEYDALTAAQITAQTVLNNSNATQKEVSDATTALNNALAACIAAVKPFAPDLAKTYAIIHYSGLYLNALAYEEGSIANCIDLLESNQSDSQKITFAASDVADAYTISIASVPGKYLTRYTGLQSGSTTAYDDYKLVWGDDATSPYAKYEMKRVGVQNYYTIKCITAGPQRSNSYFGTDDTNSGTGVYVDKTGTSTNHYWKIEDFDGTAIKNIVKNNVLVYSGKGMLTVANLEGTNKVSVYSISGQLISTQTGVSGQYTKQLPQGIYILVVDGATQYRGKAVVR
ncbi:MAG: FIVAR domain-containing protein [Dysgonamonadaceae bacterium]|jgi:hypothetical protein|nr:FIVAR domain-containing protein [Dysgonamonadaceae bacterium]